MEHKVWHADLVASTRTTARREVGLIVIEPRSGQVLATNERAVELVGAPIPGSVADLVEHGLVARPDIDRLRSELAAWRRSLPAGQEEVARSWRFALRVHPQGARTRELQIEAVHHLRRNDDAEAVTLWIHGAEPAVEGPVLHRVHRDRWTLYDLEMRQLASEPLPVPDAEGQKVLAGVLVASAVSPEELARLVPVVTATLMGEQALGRYCCEYRLPGRLPQLLDCELRVVAGTGPWPAPTRRYLIVDTLAEDRRDSILPGMVSERQLAVLDAIFAGERPQQIADAQGVGVSTIRFHLAAAYQALGVSGRDELVARYCAPCLVEEPVTVSIVEEGGVRFPNPEGPPGMIGKTETRRLEGIDGWIEVALTRWTADVDRQVIPDGLLTAKESAVVAALFDGLRPAAIAEREGVAVKTVRKRLSAAYAKLGVDGQAALTRTFERPDS